LGLSVAARIVAAFDGRIEVKSTLGKGSQFTICLPQADPIVPDETQSVR
jgi:signal transduction histidine kinase